MTRHTPVFQRTFSQMLLCVGHYWLRCRQSRASEWIRTHFPAIQSRHRKSSERDAICDRRTPSCSGWLRDSTSADHPLDRYQRGYYQSKFQVSAAPSGGSVVRVSVQVTAWYADPVAAKSGYQLLTSNGRLEADLLDQLADQLAANAPRATPSPSPNAPVTAAAKQPKSPRQQQSQLSPRPSPDFRKSAVVIHRPWPRVCRRRNKPARKPARKSPRKRRRPAANRSGQPGRDSQEPGTSQESCRREEVRHSGGSEGEFDRQDFISGQRPR